MMIIMIIIIIMSILLGLGLGLGLLNTRVFSGLVLVFSVCEYIKCFFYMINIYMMRSKLCKVVNFYI